MFRAATLFFFSYLAALTIFSAWGNGQYVPDGNSVTQQNPRPLIGRRMPSIGDDAKFRPMDEGALRGALIVISVLGVAAALLVLTIELPKKRPPAA